MKTFEFLPYAHVHDERDLRVDAEGRPVWPIVDDAELSALAAYVAAHGGELRLDEGSSAPTEALEGDVLALDERVADVARLYAHLTGRRYLLHTSGDAIPDVDVVVLSSDRLSAALLEELYRPDRARVPGLVYGRDRRELRLQALVRAAAARVTPRVGTSLAIEPQVGVSMTADEARALRARTLAGATRGAPLLTVSSHSDGLCAWLSPRLFVCPVAGGDGAEPAERSPLCATSRSCPRVRAGVGEGVAEGLLLAPERMSARVLLFGVCFGVLDADAPLGRGWSATHRLAMSGAVGALLTTWGVSYAAPRLGELVPVLERGATLGEAVREFNAREGIHASASKLCILGDPSVRAACAGERESVHIDVAPVRAGEEKDSATVERAANGEARAVATYEGELSLLGAALARHRAWPILDAATIETIERAQQGVAELRSIVRERVPSPVEVRAMHAAVLPWMLDRGRIFAFWIPSADAAHFAPKACALCGTSGTEAHYRLAAHAGAIRRHASCPRCQVVEDAPVGTRMQLQVGARGEIRLRGRLPAKDCTVAGVIWSADPSDGERFVWPTAPDGRLSAVCHAPMQRERGVVQVTAFVLFGASFLMLNQRVAGFDARGDAAGAVVGS